MPASREDVPYLSGAPRTATRISCPSRDSLCVAQVLGDSCGVSYVCTACGHSWS
ncbi:hypothetical protein [Streptomyces sp. NPDC023838]|uniref:hypothetical protein n=1 Tax=unclassified Streptomyces TaxID=2593676 RepID=UPI0033C8CD2A